MMRPGHLFDLERLKVNDRQLNVLAEGMVTRSGGHRPDGSMPAGYTYLSQMVSHDLSWETREPGLREANAPRSRSIGIPGLTLRGLYGVSPAETSGLFEADGCTFKVGETTFSLNSGIRQRFPNDLPRVAKGRLKREAIVGDPRNDENLALAQLHVAFLKWHNRVVCELKEKGVREEALMEEARRILSQHYQSMVLHDLIPRLLGKGWGCGKAMIEERVRRMQGLPVEFALAGFRFGHSMVRESYAWNTMFSEDGALPRDARLERLLELTGRSKEDWVSLPSQWIIDWRRMVTEKEDEGGLRANYAKLISPRLASALGNLEELKARGMSGNLAFRTLTLGREMGLPSGQAVADLLEVQRLSDDELTTGIEGEALREARLVGNTPLWFYLLREAEVRKEGKHLGPVGACIVGTVLMEAVRRSPWSILRENWAPSLKSKKGGVFTLADMLVFVDDMNPLGDLARRGLWTRLLGASTWLRGRGDAAGRVASGNGVWGDDPETGV